MKKLSFYQTKAWMDKIAKFRKYKNMPSGDAAGRTLVKEWKRAIIQSYDKMPRQLAESLGLHAGVSSRQIYKIFSQRRKI